MKSLLQLRLPNLRSRPPFLFCFALVVARTILSAGCGGGGMMSGNPVGTPIPAANTNVTLLLSSTANDQLTQFLMSMGTITLSSQDGKTVTLYTNPNLDNIQYFDDDIHLSGTSEPVATTSIPQGLYTSATLTFVNPSFMLVLGPTPTSSFTAAIYADVLGTEPGTIDLPAPITISGTSEVLRLDLRASQSYTLMNAQPFANYMISPAFNLTPVAVASSPMNDQNGKETGLSGRIASVNAAGNGLTMQTTNRSTITVTSSPQFQGNSDSSGLAVGTFVETDAAFQSDGSLLATRIAWKTRLP